MVTSAGENSQINLIERTLAHEILTCEESDDAMSDFGKGYMDGHIDGLCYALRLTEKYPTTQPFDIEWAQGIK